MTASNVGPAPTADSFDSIAALYEATTYPYPEAALDWMLPAGVETALDLGAGTGQLARALHARKIDTIAIDPSRGMRDELSRNLPDIRVMDGTAEQIPLPDHSVDVVLVGHAWHWFDVPAASREIARVLRPGGRLSLVWNVRDERIPWVKQLDAIVHQGTEYRLGSENPEVNTPFEPFERHDVTWHKSFTKAALVEFISVRLDGTNAAPDVRAQILADVRNLLDNDPDLSGRADVALPYVARCSRSDLA
ncbi:class I SAM-dependent methyltransferase [Nocardia sp. NPDC048505]|uniref:class I SAM-dependent methyltransferase n=1 Tax=Nocardia sp. NPDC048505 TaxID=3155756 RepID=UPI0033FB68A6